MRRIVSTYENSLPNSQADAEVVVNTAAALARRGHDVRLISPASAIQRSSPEEIRDYYGVRGPLEVIVQEGPGGSLPIAQALPRLLERGRQHITQALTLPPSLRPDDVDLIYTRHIPLALRAMRLGHRVFFDHYRPWGDQIPPMQPLIRAMAGHPGFLGMVTHSAVAASAYMRIGIPKEMVEVRHNGYDPVRMQPVLSKAEARRQLGLERERSTVVYSGRVNEKKGLDIVLAMAEALPEVLFILVGSEGRGAIETKAESLENVRIIPWQTFAETTPYLYASDVLIIPPSAAPMEQHGSTVLPLKVYLYLAAGRPILAGATPDICEVLNDTNACLVPSGDVVAATRALEGLFANPKRSDALGAAARARAAELTWDKRAEKIERFVEHRLEASHVRLSDTWRAERWMRECAEWLREGVRRGQWIRGPAT